METAKLLKRVILATVTAVVLCAVYSSPVRAEGTWLYYSGDEITGTVVDAYTEEPLEGVIVIAQWQLTEVPGGGFGGFAHIGDAVTAKDGSFTIPSWWSFRPWRLIRVVHRNAPRIFVYKPGYRLIWTHKLSRAGYPDRMDLTKEEKAEIKDADSLTPAKLKRIKTDEERINNEDDWGTDGWFPNEYFTKAQTRLIYKALEEEMKNLSDRHPRKKAIRMRIKEQLKFWGGVEE